MVCYNVQNCLKAALLFTVALVATYGLSPVQSPMQNSSDTISARSLAATTVMLS